jgi:hypothetical protein
MTEMVLVKIGPTAHCRRVAELESVLRELRRWPAASPAYQAELQARERELADVLAQAAA